MSVAKEILLKVHSQQPNQYKNNPLRYQNHTITTRWIITSENYSLISFFQFGTRSQPKLSFDPVSNKPSNENRKLDSSTHFRSKRRFAVYEINEPHTCYGRLWQAWTTGNIESCRWYSDRNLEPPTRFSLAGNLVWWLQILFFQPFCAM